ncbi:response regulator, partial [Paenibacillus sepulcri]|nr:response regulator [Paenibacillus sepulcri]
MKVMIVEDEILVRLGLRKAIPWTSLGMELVCEAKDGAEAYEMFKQHLPDIVLVDIELPKMDGLKFIRFAKSHRSESRFIVLTCHQDMKYTREAIQLQVSDFLLKSTLDMKELCDILQNISFAMAVERGDAEKKKLLSIPVDLTMQEFMRNWQSGAMDSNQIRHQLARMGMAEAGRYQACVLQLDLESESPPMSQDDSPFMIGGVEDAGNRRWHFILSGDSA